jgi:hypothetical protein
MYFTQISIFVNTVSISGCVNPFQLSDALPRLQNAQELAPLFICWVTLAYTAVRRNVSAVC